MMINYEAPNKVLFATALTFCLFCCLWRTDATTLSHVAPYLIPARDLTEINIEKATITKDKISYFGLTLQHYTLQKGKMI